MLLERLQPVLRQPPKAESADKIPEEALSDLGSAIRRNRRAVEGINGMLVDILQNLAL